MRDDLTRLVKRAPAEKRLEAAETPEPIRAQTGLERKQVGEVATKEVTVQSTDGLFTFTVRVLK